VNEDGEYLPADVDQRGKRSVRHKQLVDRWKTAEGRALADEITYNILRRKRLDKLKALGRVGGRVDLRGFGFPATGRLNQLGLKHPERYASNVYIVLEKIQWSGLDFSHGRLGALQFFNSQIEDCVFDDAFCEDWTVRKTRVSDSTFRRTNLRGSVVGAFWEGRGNVWERVNFDHTDLRGANLRGSKFLECQFGTINTAAHDGFIRCQLEKVTFSGPLRNFLFDMRHDSTDLEPAPGPIKDCDFTAADLIGVQFRGVSFQDSRFSDDFDLKAAMT
jgi:uncharacterized protein YjbI with pentapeptide repeats